MPSAPLLFVENSFKTRDEHSGCCVEAPKPIIARQQARPKKPETNDKKKNENQNTNKKDDAADDEDGTTLSEVVLPFAVIDEQAAALLRSDIRVLLQNQLLINNSQTTPRVLTRIFHGLSSPTFEGKEFTFYLSILDTQPSP